MGLFERIRGEKPEEYLEKLRKERGEEAPGSATDAGAIDPETATHAETIEAWRIQPSANDPASRAADRIALEQARAAEQAQSASQTEGQAEDNNKTA